MTVQLEFLSGSRQGAVVPIERGTPLTVGRSRSNAVQLTEPDISGEHLRVVMSGSGEVELENLSQRPERTHVNGIALAPGERGVVNPGDEVALGGKVVCRLVAVDGKAADSQPTICGISNSPSSVTTGRRPPSPIDVTMIQCTMQASDEEMEKIKAGIRAKQRRRTFMWIAPVVALLATLVTLYVVLRPKPEEFTSWPKSSDGKDLNAHVLVAPYLAIVYPGIPGSSVSTNEPGRIVVNSALGQQHDIPLGIIVRTVSDPATLEEDHRDAFDQAVRRMSESDLSFSAGVNRMHRFIATTTSAGVPLSYLNYTRRDGEDELFGYFVFLRRASDSFLICIEVPLAAQWRAEEFLRSSIAHFVIYANRRIAEHWEGCGWYRRGTDAGTDLDEARKFLNQKAPVHWEAAFMRIESALVKASKAGNATEVDDAMRMLVSLREAQTIWYNQQKLSYLAAKVSGRKEAMMSIQSLSESAFTPLFQDFDFRYELIKRRDWR